MGFQFIDFNKTFDRFQLQKTLHYDYDFYRN